MTCGLITLAQKNKLAIFKKREMPMKKLSKIFHLEWKKECGNDIFTYGLTMLFLRNPKQKMLKTQILYTKERFNLPLMNPLPSPNYGSCFLNSQSDKRISTKHAKYQVRPQGAVLDPRSSKLTLKWKKNWLNSTVAGKYMKNRLKYSLILPLHGLNMLISRHNQRKQSAHEPYTSQR